MSAYSLLRNFKSASRDSSSWRSRSVVPGLRRGLSGNDKELLSERQTKLHNFLMFLNTYKGGTISQTKFDEKFNEVYDVDDTNSGRLYPDKKITKKTIMDIVIEKRGEEPPIEYKLHLFTASITSKLVDLFSVSKADKQELRKKFIPEPREDTDHNTLSLLTMGLLSLRIISSMYMMDTGSGIKKQKRRRTNKNVRVKNKQKRRRNKSQKKRLSHKKRISRKKRLSHKKRLSRKKR